MTDQEEHFEDRSLSSRGNFKPLLQLAVKVFFISTSQNKDS
jgi:hypothetical protein